MASNFALWISFHEFGWFRSPSTLEEWRALMCGVCVYFFGKWAGPSLLGVRGTHWCYLFVVCISWPSHSAGEPSHLDMECSICTRTRRGCFLSLPLHVQSSLVRYYEDFRLSITTRSCLSIREMPMRSWAYTWILLDKYLGTFYPKCPK